MPDLFIIYFNDKDCLIECKKLVNVKKKKITEEKQQKADWFKWLCVGALLLKDWNVVVDLGAMLLSHTLGYPNDITAFLLLELQIRIKYAEMELLHETIDV